MTIRKRASQRLLTGWKTAVRLFFDVSVINVMLYALVQFIYNRFPSRMFIFRSIKRSVSTCNYVTWATRNARNGDWWWLTVTKLLMDVMHVIIKFWKDSSPQNNKRYVEKCCLTKGKILWKSMATGNYLVNRAGYWHKFHISIWLLIHMLAIRFRFI